MEMVTAKLRRLCTASWQALRILVPAPSGSGQAMSRRVANATAATANSTAYPAGRTSAPHCGRLSAIEAGSRPGAVPAENGR